MGDACSKEYALQKPVGVRRQKGKRDVEHGIPNPQGDHDVPERVAQKSHRDGNDVVGKRNERAVQEEEKRNVQKRKKEMSKTAGR